MELATVKPRKSFGPTCIEYLHAKQGEEKAAVMRELLEYEREGVVVFMQCRHDAKGWKAAALDLRCRALLTPAITGHRGRIITHPRNVIIAVYESPEDAVMAACSCLHIAAQTGYFGLAVGMDSGPIFDIGNDVFGHAVNVASKLCEDVGCRQSLAASQAVCDAAWLPLFGAALPDTGLQKKKISGASIVFHRVVYDAVATNAEAFSARSTVDPMNVETDPQRWASAYIAGEAPVQYVRRGVVIVSDLSGMTQVTAAKGIAHFMGLVCQLQALAQPIYAKHGGRLIRTEGDDLVLLFESATPAFAACREIMDAVRRYNTEHPGGDAQILLCAGMAEGEYMMPSAGDIHGGAADVAYHLGEESSHPFEIWMDQNVWEQAVKSEPLDSQRVSKAKEGRAPFYIYRHQQGEGVPAERAHPCCAIL